MMMTYVKNVCGNSRPHHVIDSILRGTGGIFGRGLNCAPKQHVSLSRLRNILISSIYLVFFDVVICDRIVSRFLPTAASFPAWESGTDISISTRVDPGMHKSAHAHIHTCTYMYTYKHTHTHTDAHMCMQAPMHTQPANAADTTCYIPMMAFAREYPVEYDTATSDN